MQSQSLKSSQLGEWSIILIFKCGGTTYKAVFKEPVCNLMQIMGSINDHITKAQEAYMHQANSAHCGHGKKACLQFFSLARKSQTNPTFTSFSCT